MKQIRDAVVIGSGIIGCATALALTRAGIKRVSMIDKGPLVSGMTRRSAGLAHPFHAHPLLCKFARAGFDFYQQWAMRLGGKSAFVETGAAVMELQGEAAEVFAMWKEVVPNASGIAVNALRALYPPLREQFRAAMFTPRAGYADAVLTAQAMGHAAKEHGLEIQTGTLVKQIVVEARHIKGVKTTTGELEAPLVIVAAGGWTEKLLLPLGINLNLRFRRGAVAFFEQPPSITSELPMLLDARGAHFFRPHPYRMSAAGNVAAEGSAQGVEGFDDFVSPRDMDAIHTFLTDCVPAFAHVPPKRAHAIVYATMADGLPALGRAGAVNGLYVAAGFGASAFSVAPAVGEMVAQMAIDASAADEVLSFDPMRG